MPLCGCDEFLMPFHQLRCVISGNAIKAAKSPGSMLLALAFFDISPAVWADILSCQFPQVLLFRFVHSCLPGPPAMSKPKAFQYRKHSPHYANANPGSWQNAQSLQGVPRILARQKP